jgi:hypothetical protein
MRDHERLHYSMLLDAIRELRERLIIKYSARLVRVWHKALNYDLLYALANLQ